MEIQNDITNKHIAMPIKLEKDIICIIKVHIKLNIKCNSFTIWFIAYSPLFTYC